MKKIFITVLVVSFLYGCAVTTDNIILDKHSNNLDNGYLVVGLDSDLNTSGYSLLSSVVLHYIKEKGNAYDSNKLVYKGKNTDKYIVVELPADRYRIISQNVGNRWLTLKQNKEFVITPKTITYIGDITSNVDIGLFGSKYDIRIDDRFKDAKNYLNHKYSRLISTSNISKQIIKLSKGRETSNYDLNTHMRTQMMILAPTF